MERIVYQLLKMSGWTYTYQAMRRNDDEEGNGIIIGTTIGGVLGLFLLGVLVYYIHKRIKNKKERLALNNELNRVDALIRPYIDLHPTILEMGDHMIPRYLQDNIPGLNDKDSHLAVFVVARRRVELC